MTPGAGNVNGPASSTDNAVVRFDGTTGKLVQNSLITVDDSGSQSLPAGQQINIGTTIKLGGLDALSRTQFWNGAPSSIIRLGASSANGDSFDAASEGIVVYDGNLGGTQNSTNVGYARVKHNRFGLYSQTSGGSADYYFRVDPTSLFLADNNMVKTFEVARTSGNVTVISTGTISNPGAGANSEKFGASAAAAGARSVAIGNSASSAGTESVAIGQAVTTSQLESVGIGYGTATTGARATGIGAYCTSSNASTIAVGNGATATRSGGIAIGGASYAATAGAGQIAIGQAAQAMADGSVVVGYSSFVANSAYTESIVIGAIVAATAANQLVIGSTVSSGTLNTYIGKGVTHATPAATTTIQATGGSGTNIAGGGLAIAGGKGTGNAAGGAISFQTSDAGASGTTLQSLTTKMTLDVNGKLGIGTVSPSGLLDVNSDVIRIRTAKTPASATATGNQGDFCWDSSYLYICTATDTWRRVAHASW